MAARFVRDEEAAGSNPATPTSSQATPHDGTWPFPCRTAAKYSNGLLPSLFAEPLKRPQRLGVRHLGIDIHRHVDLSMTKYPHGHPRMNVERREQGGTRMPGVVDRDTPDSGPGAAPSSKRFATETRRLFVDVSGAIIDQQGRAETHVVRLITQRRPARMSVSPRCPRPAINSQRSPPTATRELEARARFEATSNAREHARNA